MVDAGHGEARGAAGGYDVIVVGGGHAGIEAGYAAAQLGAATALVTIRCETIGQMSCNPAIGGLAKGQIVREVDALGGLMGRAIDATGIQFRMLNRSKGPAVWAPRAQADKQEYSRWMRRELSGCASLTIIEEMVEEVVVRGGRVKGVRLRSGRELAGAAVVLTTGTFLRGLLHTGQEERRGGRYGEPAAERLSEGLERVGLRLERLKTGTPPRVAAESVDFDGLQEQPGDEQPAPFSFMSDAIEQEQVCCWITYTNERTHEIIRTNLDRAPLYTGQIRSTGPRYCPSIETKVVRFAERARHQVFLEPEGKGSNWIYCNGISTSLPRDVQKEMVRSIAGLERAEILRYGYAIEYDYVPPVQIRATLETKVIEGLFLAGQINGTSGYEEAAGQGLVAGVNAARRAAGREPVMLGRDEAYIGVMIDDLVTRGVDEPYRMFTSRAEHRLVLRSDNADQRLTPIGHEWGLVGAARWTRFQAKQRQVGEIRRRLHTERVGGKTLAEQLRRQGRDRAWLAQAAPDLAGRYESAALEQVINEIRYAGYVGKQQRFIERCRRAERVKLPGTFDYRQIRPLRREAQEKLNTVQPLNLGQASRISGINPADVAVLMLHFAPRG